MIKQLNTINKIKEKDKMKWSTIQYKWTNNSERQNEWKLKKLNVSEWKTKINMQEYKRTYKQKRTQELSNRQTEGKTKQTNEGQNKRKNKLKTK